MIKISCLISLIIILLELAIQVESIKLTIEPICLSDIPSESILRCENTQSRLFITSKQYSNDVTNYCNKTLVSSENIKKCNAYNTQQLANECNGKQECIVKLDRTNFTYGFMGSTCDFRAEILSITYECIPTVFSDGSMPKFDICVNSNRNNIIDHPIHGFIHSPSYPNPYPSKQYCQLTIRLDETIDRIEIFLIDMHLEGLSTTTYKPTDYLQINSNEQLYGIKNFSVVYNESATAVITFRSDLWFNKPGFLLYFQIVKFIKTTTTTTTTSTTTTTTTTTTPITTTLTINTNLTMNSTTNDTYNTSALASLSSSEKIKDLSNTYSVLDIAGRTISILISIIGVLSLIVIFLLFKKKKKMNSETTNASKIAFVNRTSDTTNVDYYLTGLDKSVGMLTCNSIGFINSAPLNQQAQFFKINYNNRRPDDSAIQLLINGSISTSSASDQVNLKSTTEVYEDINLEAKKENLINENFKKMNEYHYIPLNVLKQDGSNDIIQTACTNFNGQLDISSSISSSSRSSSSFNSPSRITSTPTAPKTLPPTRLDLSNSFSIKINNDEIQNDEINSNNNNNTTEYKSFLTDSETVVINNNNNINNNDENNTTLTIINEKVNNKIESDEQNYEYQIPSNLPTK